MRYSLLSRIKIQNALDSLRSAFLAAKDGYDVDEIMNGLLTEDEKIRIGRRIEIASLLMAGMTFDEIKSELQIGYSTIAIINSKIKDHPRCFELIEKRDEKEQKEYDTKKYKSKMITSKKVFRKKESSGFRRKDVRR